MGSSFTHRASSQPSSWYLVPGAWSSYLPTPDLIHILTKSNSQERFRRPIELYPRLLVTSKWNKTQPGHGSGVGGGGGGGGDLWPQPWGQSRTNYNFMHRFADLCPNIYFPSEAVEVFFHRLQSVDESIFFLGRKMHKVMYWNDLFTYFVFVGVYEESVALITNGSFFHLTSITFNTFEAWLMLKYYIFSWRSCPLGDDYLPELLLNYPIHVTYRHIIYM